MEIFTLAASIVAIVISVYSLSFNRRLEHETSSQTLIHDQYELCRVLDVLRVDNPDLSHMLPLPAQTGGDTWKHYEVFKQLVRSIHEAAGPITEASRARMYLREHATALDVCNIYEQTLLQRELAQRARDKGRFSILDGLARYYEERMLRSPRMRFHWDNGASDMMEQGTRDRYDKNVRNSYPGDRIDAKSPLDD